MAKNPKTNRTQIKDLSISEQEITGQEMKQVKGGKEEQKHKFEKIPVPAPTPIPPMPDNDPPLDYRPIPNPNPPKK